MAVGLLEKFWSIPVDDLLVELGSDRQKGLSGAQAQERLQHYGKNTVVDRVKVTFFRLLFDRFSSPLVLILLFAAFVALFVGDWGNAVIIIFIILISSFLSLIQEYKASQAVAKLQEQISVKATLMRDGHRLLIPLEDVVPGDIVMLAAGSLIPADGVLLSAKDFYVSQALLTGEPYPVEKAPGLVAAESVMAARTNCVFMGTSVRSGTALALVVRTARNAAYGQIAEELMKKPPESDFEAGVRHYGNLLIRIMLIAVLVVFVINTLLHRNTLDTLLFSLALAVGMSPELLPAILTVTLSHAARTMAKKGVIVRRLNAIEELGSMNVLCCDKTGTLTKGVMELSQYVDAQGESDDNILHLGWLNASMQTGLPNPMDEAIQNFPMATPLDISHYTKIDEIPYDFLRRRLSVVLRTQDRAAPLMITKGAFESVLGVCQSMHVGDQLQDLDQEALSKVRRLFIQWSEQGHRVIGVATRELPTLSAYGREHEQNMVFAGFLVFFDPPKKEVAATLLDLQRLGIEVKIISGDNSLVVKHVAREVGILGEQILTGQQVDAIKEPDLARLVKEVQVFAEIGPNQKERIILALKKSRVVGFFGDGINDAPALQAADVGISVDSAVDVAKETADIMLTKHDLRVLSEGVALGRRSFANTLKYIFIATSAHFGNMISLGLASTFLPFLPMLAKQILLNNLLSDVPAMGIANDNVDAELEAQPQVWNVQLIRNFMIIFGLVSTIFDLLTFGALWWMVGSAPELFRTGWFVESLLTELAVLIVIRTRKPFYKSLPSPFLLFSSVVIAAIALIICYTPIAHFFGFISLPPLVLLAMVGITLCYIIASELTKRILIKAIGY